MGFTLQTMVDRISGKERRDAAQLVLAAYLVLLQIPHASPLRTASQSTMARCVHFIAETLGLEPEHVQTECEAAAVQIGLELDEWVKEAKEKADPELLNMPGPAES